MGMGNSFETITVLQYRLKEAQEELAAFQSGEKYIRMEKQHLTQVRALERRIAKLEAAVAKEHSHAITIWNQWFEIFEQLQKECDRMVAEAVKKADMMEKRAIRIFSNTEYILPTSVYSQILQSQLRNYRLRECISKHYVLSSYK